MLNFRKPLTRNWSCCANFYNYFILRTNYDRTCEDHLFFSRIVDFFLIHETIHARYSKEKKRKEKKHRNISENVSCRGKFRKNAYFISSSTSVAFLPPDGNRVRVFRIFALYVSAPVETSFQHGRTGVNVNALVWTSRWWTLSPAWIGSTRDDNKLRPRFPRFDERNPWFSRLQINKLT